LLGALVKDLDFRHEGAGQNFENKLFVKKC
jgi:hypothetical protein